MLPEALSSDVADWNDLAKVSMVLRLRGFSLEIEVVELPRELRGPEKEDMCSRRADEGLVMTLSLLKPTLSIDSAMEESLL
jgi:hypothetical protein